MRKWSSVKFGENKMLVVSAVLCLLALVVMTVALVFGRPRIQADFVPPPVDEHAVFGLPEVPENLSWAELDARVFRVTVCGMVAASDGAADIWMTSPAENDVWLKLRVLDQDGSILGETGLIMPGQYVRAVVLNEVPAAGTPVCLKIMAYEPETYYSAGSISLNAHLY